MIYESGNTQLFYQVLGDGQTLAEGPAVVLVHPTPVDHRFWLPVAACLSGYRMLLPDLRGHGLSQLGEGGARVHEPISIALLAEDILQLMNHVGLERAHFVGCSIGGYTLFELWRKAPQRIASLVFCCSKPQSDGPEAKAKRLETMARIRSQGTEEFIDRTASSLVGAAAQKRDPGIVERARAMMTLVPEAVIAVQQALAGRQDSVATARTITVPTLVIAGGEDAFCTPAEAQVLADSVPGSEMHVLNDAGHFAAYEQPERVGAMVLQFLDRSFVREEKRHKSQ